MPGIAAAPFLSALGRTPTGIANTAIQGAQQAGYFDPMGSPYLRNLRRQLALQNNAAFRQQTSGYGQLIGLDPMAQQGALMNQNLQGNAQLSQGLLQGGMQEGLGAENFLRNLYMNQLNFQQQRQLQREQQKQQSRGGIGGMLGGLAGGALGFLTGGPAGAMGGFGMGRGMFGGGGQQGYNYGQGMMPIGYTPYQGPYDPLNP